MRWVEMTHAQKGQHGSDDLREVHGIGAYDRKHGDGRGLTRTIAPEQRHGRPRLDGKVEIVDGGHGAKAFGEAARDNRKHGRVRRAAFDLCNISRHRVRILP